MLKIINEKNMFNPALKEYESNPQWYKGIVEILTTKGPVKAEYEIKVENNFITDLLVTLKNTVIAAFNKNGWITKPADKISDNIVAHIYSQYGAPIFMK